MIWERNAHGVEGRWSHSGTMYGRHEPDPQQPGKTRFRAAIPLFVPRVCCGCPHLDQGEHGDYGDLLSVPFCERNVWFPTKKGTCKTKDSL